MVLGDLGARVIKVEPPQGSPSRRVGPFLKGAPEPECSLQYFAFNRNKLGITLDLESDPGHRALLALAENADFIFESAKPGEMRRMALGFGDLRAVNSRIIYTAITAFGQDGPYADYATSDLSLSALSGQMSLQGVPDRAPVRMSVPQAWLHASTEASVGALTAHALMLKTGEAQFVDVSAQTSLLWTMLHARAAYAIQNKNFEREGSNLQLGSITLPLVYECTDGYVIPLPTGERLAKMVHWFIEDGVVPHDWIDGEDWATWDYRLVEGEPVIYSLDEVVQAMRDYFSRHTKQELLERGVREDATIAPVNTVEDLIKFRQLEERGYWLTAPLPNGQEIKAPGYIARLTHTPMMVNSWAPRLGQHNDEILGGMLGLSSDEILVASGMNS